jgi:hypothetical protein
MRSGRRLDQHQPVARASDRDRQIEPRAQRQRLERPCHRARRPATERQRDARARWNIGEGSRIRDQLCRSRRVLAADPRALQHAGEAVAVAQRRGQLENGPLGRFGKRPDQIIARHPPSRVAAQR